MLLHPANPRLIDKHAEVKLRKSIKAGYVGGITVNRRTWHVVGGNQRVRLLKELHGDADRSLEVDVIDVPESEELTLLAQLNNEGMMGQWDMGKLEANLPHMNLDIAGFDRLDVESMFPDLEVSGLFSDAAEPEGVKADAAEIARIKAEKNRFKEQGGREDDAGFMIHLVGGSGEECSRFLRRLGIEENAEYVDLRRIAAAVNIDLDEGD